MKIGDFTYPDISDRLFNIQYDQSRHHVPLTFFKYYSLNYYGVDALVNSYIYASHPNQLNDPFDCNNDIIIFDDEDSIRSLLGELYHEVSANFSHSDFPPRAFNTIAYKKCGIFSLATNHVHPLMWAHYAGKNGFCIEFDVREFPFEYYGPFPMNYVKTLPSIKTSQTSIWQALAIQCSVKQSLWSYEDEWRIIVPSPKGLEMKSYGYWSENMNIGCEVERKFPYPTKAIKRIILGAEFLSPERITKLTNTIIQVSDLSDNKLKVLHQIVNKGISTSLLYKQSGGNFGTIDVDIQEVNNQSFIIFEL